MINIKRSLSLLILSALILMLISSGSTFVLMNKSAQTLVEHIHTDVDVERHLSKLLSESLGLRLAVLAKITNPSNEQPNRSYERAEQEMAIAIAEIQRMKIEKLDRLLVLHSTWMRLSQQMMQDASQARTEQALATISTEAPIWQAFRVPLLEELALSSEQANTAYQEASQRRNQAVTSTLLLMALALILMTFISLVFYRRMSLALGGDVNYAVKVTHAIAEGDLSLKVEVAPGADTSLLAGLSRMQVGLQTLVSLVKRNAEDVSQEAQSVHSKTDECLRLTQLQAQSTDTVASAMTEMTASAHEVSSNVARTAQAARIAEDKAVNSQQQLTTTLKTLDLLNHNIQDTSQVMNDLQARTEGINQIIDVIRNIAEQTNLLALNAAIEAARAGDQGRGFAVVADEVRTLATRSAQSTEKISEVIGALIAESRRAHQAMEKSREQTLETVTLANTTLSELNEMMIAIEQIADMSTQIASAAEQQSMTADDINRNMITINEMSEASRQAFNETFSSTERLSHSSKILSNEVEKFKVR